MTVAKKRKPQSYDRRHPADTSGEKLRMLVLTRMEQRDVAPEKVLLASMIQFPTSPLHTKILGTSSKVELSRSVGVLTAVVYLAPAEESVVYGGSNLCPFANACAGPCLGHKGRLHMSTATNSKAWKTLTLMYAPEVFRAVLRRAIYTLETKAMFIGMRAGVRLNGCSDVVWESIFPEVFDEFPNVIFYDYTKIPSRMFRPLPANYQLTFSRSEETANHRICEQILREKTGNVAMVFENASEVLRRGQWNGFPVLNGDVHDCRPVDGKLGHIVVLKPKGHATDDTGFFISAETTRKAYAS